MSVTFLVVLVAYGWAMYWLGFRCARSLARWSPPPAVPCDRMLAPRNTVFTFRTRDRWSSR